MMKLSRLLLALSSIFISFSLFAQDTTQTNITITTPAPVATCTNVASHWEGKIWVEAHNVCKYENRPEGVAWINDYWSCTEASADGKCTTWALVPGHWVTTLP